MQEQFDKSLIDLGDVEGGRKYVMPFIYLGEQRIEEVKPSCGSCTTVQIEGNVVALTFTAGRIDSAYVADGIKRMPQSKYATVFFDDGRAERLTFNYTLLE